MSEALPGTPGKALQALWGYLSGPERDALLPHLIGSTSAEWVASTLNSQGYSVGATTIRTYRRSLRQNGTAQ